MKSKEVRQFLSGLSNADFRYLEIQMSLAKDSRGLIDKFKISQERFCELMEIDLSQYQDFLNGAFDYDIQKMALLHCAWVTLRSEQAKKEADETLTGISK